MTKGDTGQRAEGTDQTVDALLRDLVDALAVRPSPDFGVNVRSRIQATTPASSSRWAWRWGFIAGALATIVLLAVLVRVKSDRPGVVARDAQVPSMVTAPAVPSAMPSPITVVEAVVLPRRARVSGKARVGADVPQVLVAPDQAAAVRYLLDRVRQGDVLGTSSNEDGDPLATLEIDELAPIPLIVIPPLAAPPSGGAGSRK